MSTDPGAVAWLESNYDDPAWFKTMTRGADSHAPRMFHVVPDHTSYCRCEDGASPLYTSTMATWNGGETDGE